MYRRFLTHALTFLTAIALFSPVLVSFPQRSYAAATMSISASAEVTVGRTVDVGIYVNTGGVSANAFDATLTYPTAMFDAVRGTTSGGVCNITITNPTPSGGQATVTCGTTGGFNGSGLIATVVLAAKTADTGTFTLKNCEVLANDENATTLLSSGSCASRNIATVGATASTPTNTPTPPPGGGTPTPPPSTGGGGGGGNTIITPSVTKAPKPTPIVTPSTGTVLPTNPLNPETNQPAVAAETPDNTDTGTTTGELPPAQPIPSGSPEPPSKISQMAGSAQRTVSQAFSDLFATVKDARSIFKSITGVIAILIAIIPILLIILAIVYFLYRLYILERRRKRTLDRLFEMELSELAALEGKLDLLAEKGAKGRDEYREEFRKTKEHILRQLKPEFGKGVTEGEPNLKMPKFGKKDEKAAPATAAKPAADGKSEAKPKAA